MRRSSAWVGAVSVGFGCVSLSMQASLAQEQHPRFDIGVRGVMLLSKGEPANDMIGEGLIARWQFRDGWYIGLALDDVTFDYETPEKVLGIMTTTVVDGTNDLSRTSVLLERGYESERRWDWFWRAGLGFASVDAPNVSGLAASGAPYDIVTVADDEVHLIAGGGLRRPIGQRWILESAFTFEHHDTDYRITDTVSGARGAMGAHSPYGVALGVSYRF